MKNANQFIVSLAGLAAGLMCVSCSAPARKPGEPARTSLVGAANVAERAETGPGETLTIEIGGDAMRPTALVVPIDRASVVGGARPDPRRTAPWWSPDEDAHGAGTAPDYVEIDGVRVPVDPAVPIRISRQRTGGELDARNESGAGRIDTDSAEAAANFKGSAAGVAEPRGLGARGGRGSGVRDGSSSDIGLDVSEGQRLGLLVAAAAAAALGGLALSLIRKPFSPTPVIAGGVVAVSLIGIVIVAEAAPILFVIAGIAALGLGGWLVYDWLDSNRDREALRPIVKALAAPTEEAKQGRAAVKAFVGPRDKKLRDRVDRRVTNVLQGK